MYSGFESTSCKLLVTEDGMAELPESKRLKVVDVNRGLTPVKRLSLSRSKKKLSPKSRFKEQVEPQKLAEMAKGFTPSNTSKSTDWSVKNFASWLKNRSCMEGDIERCPDDILTNFQDVHSLSHWLSLFVTETRRVDGSRYPPKTLYQLLCGLLRYMRSHNPAAPNFLDQSDHRFTELHKVCDSLFRELRSQGLGSETKQASIITKDEENLLWSRGIMGLHSPLSLIRTVFYYVGKVFCLRGREEHRNLKFSQFERKEDPDRYIYTEYTSKNRCGSLGQLRVINKSVPVVANCDAGDRCLVKILDVYLSKLPVSSKERDLFYMQPHCKIPDDPSAPWFKNQPIGKNTLGTMVKEMCQEAGIHGKTNHSLRATGATEMYVAGVPEKIIQERTGHRSLDGLRSYERSTLEQHQTVSKIASSSHSNVSYAEEFNKVTSCDLVPTETSYSTDEKSHVEESRKVNETPNLSSLFSCSTGGVFNFSPSGNVIINITPAITASFEKKMDSFSQS